METRLVKYYIGRPNEQANFYERLAFNDRPKLAYKQFKIEKQWKKCLQNIAVSVKLCDFVLYQFKSFVVATRKALYDNVNHKYVYTY